MTQFPFTITAPSNTDVWRKPPGTNAFSAPTHPLLTKPVPLTSFERARVTLSAPYTTRYDQGGLLLHLIPAADAAAGTDPALVNAQKRDRWLKTGIEFYQGATQASTVATTQWSDWSVRPAGAAANSNATFEVRREGDELGTSLWVYQLVLGDDGEEQERRPLREVTWFFAEESEWVLSSVSAMAARPGTVPEEDGLVVTFHDGEVSLNTLD